MNGVYSDWCVSQMFLWGETWPTCNDLPQLWVQVYSAGQEGAEVPGRQDGSPGGQEDLEAAHVPINLQQWLHILGGRDVLGHPVGEETRGASERLRPHGHTTNSPSPTQLTSRR